MANRISEYFRNENHEDINRDFNRHLYQMALSEEREHYGSALEENDLAYETAFDLYIKGADREFQKLRMYYLIKKADKYIEKLNQNTGSL